MLVTPHETQHTLKMYFALKSGPSTMSLPSWCFLFWSLMLEHNASSLFLLPSNFGLTTLTYRSRNVLNKRIRGSVTSLLQSWVLIMTWS